MSATLGCSLLAACAFTEPFPAGWQAVAPPTSEDCRHLEGRYADIGEGAKGQASLSRLLLGVGADGAQVRLSLPRSGALEVSAAGFRRTLRADQGEFACEKGMLRADRARWVNDGQAHGREKSRVEFGAAGDWLVARLDESVVGLAVVFPVMATQTRWYRFARIP